MVDSLQALFFLFLYPPIAHTIGNIGFFSITEKVSVGDNRLFEDIAGMVFNIANSSLFNIANNMACYTLWTDCNLFFI